MSKEESNTNAVQKDSILKNKGTKKQNHKYIANGMAVGLAIGLLIGGLLDKPSEGLAAGISVGLVVGVAMDSRKKSSAYAWLPLLYVLRTFNWNSFQQKTSLSASLLS